MCSCAHLSVSCCCCTRNTAVVLSCLLVHPLPPFIFVRRFIGRFLFFCAFHSIHFHCANHSISSKLANQPIIIIIVFSQSIPISPIKTRPFYFYSFSSSLATNIIVCSSQQQFLLVALESKERMISEP